MENKVNNEAQKTMFDAFKKSGKIGYYMLYSALRRQKEEDGRN